MALVWGAARESIVKEHQRLYEREMRRRMEEEVMRKILSQPQGITVDGSTMSVNKYKPLEPSPNRKLLLLEDV